MSENQKTKKPFYKKWWVWVIAIIIVIGLVSAGGSDSKDTGTNSKDKKQTSVKSESKKDSIKSGMYKVGKDIKAGEYVVVSDHSGAGYMQVSKDSSGDINGIICNENIQNRTIITIKDGQYFEVKDGEIYPIDKAPKVETKDNGLPSGMYKVGKDIKPGEYKVSSEANGYVEVSNNSLQVTESIVSNDNFKGEKYITVKDGQYLKINNATLKLK